MSEPLRCPHCGIRRAALAVSLDLCPTCLLATALSKEDAPCPYQVMTPIGEDSGGVTYLAQALTGARSHVALKVCGPRDDADTVLTRYCRWRPALARIQHPSIGKLLDVGLTAEGRLYVASEYVPGWPMTALGSYRSVGMSERVALAGQLTSAVEAAHAAGIVHLKLDTSKVKISTAKRPRATILGFGSSLILDGTDGPTDADQLALARIIRQLGTEP